MPGYDGTGPRGEGPMTGGGRGYCVVPGGYYRSGYRPRGAFFGRGRGGGRGWRNMYYATGMPGWMRAGYGYPAYGAGPAAYMPEPTADEEKQMLREEAAMLKQQLTDIQKRLESLEKENKTQN